MVVETLYQVEKYNMPIVHQYVQMKYGMDFSYVFVSSCDMCSWIYYIFDVISQMYAKLQILPSESFQLQMGLSFPFLRANDLHLSLLNIRALSF